MTSISDKEQKFYFEKWPLTREHKLKYVLKNGVLFFALPTYIGTYLFTHHFSIHNIGIVEISIELSVWLVMGALWGYWMFRATEKRYQTLLTQADGFDG